MGSRVRETLVKADTIRISNFSYTNRGRVKIQENFSMLEQQVR